MPEAAVSAFMFTQLAWCLIVPRWSPRADSVVDSVQGLAEMDGICTHTVAEEDAVAVAPGVQLEAALGTHTCVWG